MESRCVAFNVLFGQAMFRKNITFWRSRQLLLSMMSDDESPAQAGQASRPRRGPYVGFSGEFDERDDFFFIQYKNFTKTNYLRLHLQTTGLHNKDDDPGKQEPMTIP